MPIWRNPTHSGEKWRRLCQLVWVLYSPQMKVMNENVIELIPVVPMITLRYIVLINMDVAQGAD